MGKNETQMKLDLRIWPLLILPTLFWLALFSCATPPRPDPLAPRAIVHDWTEVDDIGPLEFPLPPVEAVEKKGY